MTQHDVITQQGRAFVVLNPVAGQTTPDAVRAALDVSLRQHGWEFAIYETQPDDDIGERVRAALNEGCDLVIAAGGDGTVSMVADSLVGTGVPLAILPAGSANVLALELGIPGDIPAAANLLTGEYEQRQLDVMRMQERHFVLQIGVGLDAIMIKDTNREAKRALGRWAYMQTLARTLLGHESIRFTIMVDGKRLRPRAAQVLIANAGTLGAKPLTWGQHIQPDDGQLDLCVVKVRTLRDYPKVIWQFVTGRRKNSNNIEYHPITQTVTIAADKPLPVQADGEIIGTTPISISVIPKGITILVPVKAEPASPIAIFREASRRSNSEVNTQSAEGDKP